MTELGLVLCTCRHEKRKHARHRLPGLRGFPFAYTQPCEQRVLEHGTTRLRRCRCLRFTEATFERQQVQLFESTPEEIAAHIYFTNYVKDHPAENVELKTELWPDTQLSLLPLDTSPAAPVHSEP